MKFYCRGISKRPDEGFVFEFDSYPSAGIHYMRITADAADAYIVGTVYDVDFAAAVTRDAVTTATLSAETAVIG